ncbi:MAG: PadR family transcriptional regulator [Lentisphaeria bacterium]|nr:PadR family transcriptional regulator [Lentisphaeria bacterium]
MKTANLTYFENWTTQARKGVLELRVLNILRHGERHGYDLVKLLVSMPGAGVAEGTVYPLLSRLRVQGLVDTRLEESSEGPARKYYRLTDIGKATVTLMNDYWNLLRQGMEEPIRKTDRSDT